MRYSLKYIEVSGPESASGRSHQSEVAVTTALEGVLWDLNASDHVHGAHVCSG